MTKTPYPTKGKRETAMDQSRKCAIESERINIRCPECHLILCARVNAVEGWVLYFRFNHRRRGVIEIYAKELAIKCRSCETMHRISAEEGVIQSYRSKDYGKNLSGQSTGNKHLCESVKT